MSFFGSVWGLSPHSSYVLVLVKVWSEKKITQDRIGLRPIVVSTSITLSQSFLKSEKDATRPGRMPADLKQAHCCLTLTLHFFLIRLKASALYYHARRWKGRYAEFHFLPCFWPRRPKRPQTFAARDNWQGFDSSIEGLSATCILFVLVVVYYSRSKSGSGRIG